MKLMYSEVIQKDMQAQPSIEKIYSVGWGFTTSKILLAAVEFQLFTRIAKNGKASAKELKDGLELKCTDSHFFAFLDILVSLGFLKREGRLYDAHYSNALDVDTYLVKGKDGYIGGSLENANKREYQFWGRLEIGLKTGTPQHKFNEEGDLFDKLYQNSEQLKVFINAMDSFSSFAFESFAAKFDATQYKTVLDLGGAGAKLSISLAKRNPHLTFESLDMPHVCSIAQENIEKCGLTERIKAITGDFFKSPYPKADVIVMGNILHDWDQSKKELLIKTAYESLNQGGILVAIESFIDNERIEIEGILMSLFMLLETNGGSNFTFDEYTEWVKAAGFKETKMIKLIGAQSAGIAYK